MNCFERGLIGRKADIRTVVKQSYCDGCEARLLRDRAVSCERDKADCTWSTSYADKVMEGIE